MVNQEFIMGIIMHAGNAKSLTMKALKKAEENELEQSNQLVSEADEELNKAHKIQTNLIQAESRGEQTELSLLMVHAQDHLMNAITVRDLAKHVIKLSEKLEAV